MVFIIKSTILLPLLCFLSLTTAAPYGPSVSTKVKSETGRIKRMALSIDANGNMITVYDTTTAVPSQTSIVTSASPTTDASGVVDLRLTSESSTVATGQSSEASSASETTSASNPEVTNFISSGNLLITSFPVNSQNSAKTTFTYGSSTSQSSILNTIPSTTVTSVTSAQSSLSSATTSISPNPSNPSNPFGVGDAPATNSNCTLSKYECRDLELYICNYVTHTDLGWILLNNCSTSCDATGGFCN